MADDTYPEELYIDDWYVYDYDESLWDELLATLDLEASLESDREEAGEYEAEWYGETEEPEETGEADDWEWFDK